MGRPKSAVQGKAKTVYRTPVQDVVHCRVKIERLAWGGKGLARAEDGRLIILEAPLALFPGEEVEAEIRWKARHGEGRVTGWVRPSPQRVAPECPVAESCGGCSLWGAGGATSDLKQEMVADLFRRQLPESTVWRWIPAPAWVRRHRIQLHWDGSALGFHARRSHRLVPVKACPAAAESLNRAMPRLEDALNGRILPTRPQRWELATGSPADQVWATDEKGRSWQLEPDGWHPAQTAVRHSHGEQRWSHAPGGFFQVCAPWAMEAFSQLLEDWDLSGGTLFDLYGGVGLFSGLLGSRFTHRVLVESAEEAVVWARRNLEGLGLPAECLAQDVAEWLPEGLGAPGDLIVVDPPRAGLAPEVAERLVGAGASRLILVGCDGAAFCRDVLRLGHSWQLEALAAADLFPRTDEVECLALFRRRA
nr:hypothetical protein [uncultured Holophaga sp.]